MANASAQNLKKIEDFLKDQENLAEVPHDKNQYTEKNEDAIDQIQKFLEDQSNLEERKEGQCYIIYQ